MQAEFFEWDDDKAILNIEKHGVSFEEAATVFEDVFSITERDEISSDSEGRFFTIGLSLIDRVLLVVHTERDERIRIISARKATRSERTTYEEQRDQQARSD